MLYKKLAKTLLCASLLLVLFIFVSPETLSAQLIPQQLQNTLNISVSPRHPGPNELVSLSIESFSIDLNRAHITWFLNDTLIAEGDALTTTSFTTGRLGSNSLITIFAETPDNATATETISIRPVQIDLIWQANTYTPPFYNGKALPTAGSSVSVTAFPQFVTEDGATVSPNNLIYQWEKNSDPLQEISGRGEKTATVSLLPNRETVVEVTVSSIDGILSGTERISLRPREPQLLIYEDNPLLGTLFNGALGETFSLIGGETRFIAYPYFISTRSRGATHLEYVWKLDNDIVTPGDDVGSITVNHSGGGSGNAIISLSLQNTRDFLQQAAKQFTITFGESSSSQFGL